MVYTPIVFKLYISSIVLWKVNEYFMKGKSKVKVDIIYHGNGKKSLRVPSLDGVYHGVFKQWYTSGRLSFTKTYVHGVLHGLYTRYPMRKNSITMQVLYVNGVMEGERIDN